MKIGRRCVGGLWDPKTSFLKPKAPTWSASKSSCGSNQYIRRRVSREQQKLFLGGVEHGHSLRLLCFRIYFRFSSRDAGKQKTKLPGDRCLASLLEKSAWAFGERRRGKKKKKKKKYSPNSRGFMGLAAPESAKPAGGVSILYFVH